MLVLSRKDEEEFVIDVPEAKELIRIIVLGSDKGRVRLGVIAPKDCMVLRSELVMNDHKNP